MKNRWLAALSALILVPCIGSAEAANPGVTLLGFGLVPGSALDKSGLAGHDICKIDDASDCIDKAIFGGFGSGLAYTGNDNVFVAVSDRGPFDGRTDEAYKDRFHFVALSVTGPSFSFPSQPNIDAELLDTRFFKAKGNRTFVGASGNFELRFDPEGVAVGRNGHIFVSDEYGPSIKEFNAQGRLTHTIEVPAKFLIANPSGDVDTAGNSLELYPSLNTSGRQANRGMEGLAITPDGRYLVGMMQNALIQDHGLDAATPPGRIGLNNRIVKIDLKTGKTSEYVYVMTGFNQGRGVNDLLAINDHEFLVIERDNRTVNAGSTPNLKTIFKIDLNGATDVSNIASLPATGAALAGLGIVPVTKSVLIDMLDSSYVMSASPLKTIKDVIAEKVEGLAFGPDLEDGRHVLYVITDNDLNPDLPTQIYAFAIDPETIDYKAPKIAGNVYPH